MDRELPAADVTRRRLRRQAYGLAIVVGVGLAVFGLPRWLRPGLERERVRTARVERGPIEAVLVASGTVVPAIERVVSIPVEARVVRIARRPGDAVAAGEEILELDLSAARLELDRLDDQLAQKAVERRRQELASEERLAELAGRIETQTLDEESARWRLAQRRRLRTEGLVSEEALRGAEVEARRAAIELARLTASVAAERRREAVDREELAVALRTVASQRAEAARRLELASTRAERAGVVTWVVAQEGVTVRPGDAVARVADLSAFRVEAELSDALSGRLTVGQAARVVVDGREIPARLAQIYPTVERGAVRFAVDLVAPDEATLAALRPNLRAEVLVVAQRRDDGLRLARGPAVEGGGRRRVFVVDGDRAVARPASFGLVGHRHLEVLDGLAAGDEVVLSDLGDLAGRDWLPFD